MSFGRLANITEDRTAKQPPAAKLTPWVSAGDVAAENEKEFPRITDQSTPHYAALDRGSMVEKLNTFFSSLTGKILLFVVLVTVISYFLA